MERFCGSVKRSLKSVVSPYANMDKRNLHLCWLNQLRYQYDVEDELGWVDWQRAGEPRPLTKNERTYEDCKHPVYQNQPPVDQFIDPDHIMLAPFNSKYKPGDSYRSAVAEYFKLVLGEGANRRNIRNTLPEVMPTWDKMRIQNGRVTIRGCLATLRNKEAYRVSSFIRVGFKFSLCPRILV
jgi:hypothetical protein